MSLTCEKVYRDIPFAHRQHMHDGHCAQIHGHNFSFAFTFQARELDENNFVIDFGKLKWLKEWLEDRFDHALVLNRDDPHRPYIEDALIGNSPEPLAKITIVPSGSAEGLALWVFDEVNTELMRRTVERVSLRKLVVHEDEKNSATYHGEKW